MSNYTLLCFNCPPHIDESLFPKDLREIIKYQLTYATFLVKVGSKCPFNENTLIENKEIGAFQYECQMDNENCYVILSYLNLGDKRDPLLQKSTYSFNLKYNIRPNNQEIYINRDMTAIMHFVDSKCENCKINCIKSINEPITLFCISCQPSKVFKECVSISQDSTTNKLTSSDIFKNHLVEVCEKCLKCKFCKNKRTKANLRNVDIVNNAWNEQDPLYIELTDAKFKCKRHIKGCPHKRITPRKIYSAINSLNNIKEN